MAGPTSITVCAPASMRTVRPARSGVGDSGMSVIAAPCGFAVYSTAASLHGMQSGSATPNRSAAIDASPGFPKSHDCLPVARPRSPSDRRHQTLCSMRTIDSYRPVIANAQQLGAPPCWRTLVTQWAPNLSRQSTTAIACPIRPYLVRALVFGLRPASSPGP